MVTIVINIHISYIYHQKSENKFINNLVQSQIQNSCCAKTHYHTTVLWVYLNTFYTYISLILLIVNLRIFKIKYQGWIFISRCCHCLQEIDFESGSPYSDLKIDMTVVSRKRLGNTQRLGGSSHSPLPVKLQCFRLTTAIYLLKMPEVAVALTIELKFQL